MSIEKALEIIHRYYTEEELKAIRKKKKEYGSITDTNKKFLLYSDLLNKQAVKEGMMEQERKECLQAAKFFESKYLKEFENE